MRYIRFLMERSLLTLLLLLVCSLCLRSQTIHHSPCKTEDSHAGWQIYVNHDFRFCLLYPPTYREMPTPPPDEFSSTRVFLSGLDLKHLPPGTHGGPTDNKAGIGFVYIPKPFSVRQMETCCAPTGQDDTPPATVRLGKSVFYFYGPGGGGVDYPDQYLMELNGKILSIEFGGPWKDSKSPIEETKRLETKILSTLQTY
jgi:hypothetical protein